MASYLDVLEACRIEVLPVGMKELIVSVCVLEIIFKSLDLCLQMVQLQRRGVRYLAPQNFCF